MEPQSEPTPGEIAVLGMLESVLEAQMRNYDVNLAILTAITGNRTAMDELRSQHAQGLLYFPPFALAQSQMEEADDPSEEPNDNQE